MEETRFSARVVPEKKYFKDFGRIHAKKSKLSLLFLIFALVLFAVVIVLTYLVGINDTNYALTAAYVMFFYYLFFGDSIGKSSYRSIHKKQQGLPQTYYFGETCFSTYTELESSSINYQAIGDVYENGRIFALYNTKSTAFIIPKSSFTEGTPVQFRQFISEKTGRPVKRVRTYDRTALKIVVAVLSFILMLGTWLLADWLHGQKSAQPQTFTVDNYSITLTSAFEEDTVEGYDLVVISDDAAVFLSRYTTTEFGEYFGEADNVQGYMENVAVYMGFTAGDVWMDSGTAHLEFSNDVDGNTYYYFTVLQLQGDTLYLTEFSCLDTEIDAHVDDFLTWEESITIK